ncbi:exonuclease SbcCD subunit D [Nesterenkonia marinintestina]|uniref:exonuclease SbcCD subunit D n=1 Tax=Nesterenkonia marinintestina TaxID=2979865 RepID=UPI0021C136D3|nr:exonuclease SbcCD subunit D [Nesterenkonia sp. GX14115]
MRWLHTSDWHLGRGFHGHSLEESHRETVEAVCAEVERRQVDLVLVSGDVYDRALPPEWAVLLLEECLTRLVSLGAQVVVTSGNHDSARRLGFGSGLMSAAGLHLRTRLEDAWTPVELTDDDGVPLLVYGVPYLEPALSAPMLGLERAHHTAVMTEVVRRIRRDLAQRSEDGDDGSRPRAMLMAHVFAARGVASDSERIIGAEASAGAQLDHDVETAGGLAVVPLEIFDGFDYVALGHLHGRQRLTDSVRYSGSPLRLSFSEARQAKGAWLGDTLSGMGPGPAVSAVDWSLGRPLATLEGRIDEVLDPSVVAEHAESFVQVTLTDDERPERAHQRVREAFPHLATFRHRSTIARETGTYSHAVERAVTETDVVGGFLDHVRGRAMDPEEAVIIAETLESVRAARSTGTARRPSDAATTDAATTGGAGQEAAS